MAQEDEPVAVQGGVAAAETKPPPSLEPSLSGKSLVVSDSTDVSVADLASSAFGKGSDTIKSASFAPGVKSTVAAISEAASNGVHLPSGNAAYYDPVTGSYQKPSTGESFAVEPPTQEAAQPSQDTPVDNGGAWEVVTRKDSAAAPPRPADPVPEITPTTEAKPLQPEQPPSVESELPSEAPVKPLEPEKPPQAEPVEQKEVEPMPPPEVKPAELPKVDAKPSPEVKPVELPKVDSTPPPEIEPVDLPKVDSALVPESADKPDAEVLEEQPVADVKPQEAEMKEPVIVASSAASLEPTVEAAPATVEELTPSAPVAEANLNEPVVTAAAKELDKQEPVALDEVVKPEAEFATIPPGDSEAGAEAELPEDDAPAAASTGSDDIAIKEPEAVTLKADGSIFDGAIATDTENGAKTDEESAEATKDEGSEPCPLPVPLAFFGGAVVFAVSLVVGVVLIRSCKNKKCTEEKE